MVGSQRLNGYGFAEREYGLCGLKVQSTPLGNQVIALVGGAASVAPEEMPGVSSWYTGTMTLNYLKGVNSWREKRASS